MQNKNPTINIIANGKILNVSPKSGTRLRSPLLSLLFSYLRVDFSKAVKNRHLASSKSEESASKTEIIIFYKLILVASQQL